MYTHTRGTRVKSKVEAEYRKDKNEPDRRKRALAAHLRAKISNRSSVTARKNTCMKYDPKSGAVRPNEGVI